MTTIIEREQATEMPFETRHIRTHTRRTRFRSFGVCLLVLFASGPFVSAQMDSEVGATHASPLLIEGVYYLVVAKDPTQAIPFFEQAMALAPTHSDPYYFAGVAYYQRGGRVATALFYFYEAEKRNIQYDKFKPNRIPGILEKYPNIKPSAPSTLTIHRMAQLTVTSEEKGAFVVVQSEGQRDEYELGESIRLEAGKPYTIKLEKKRLSQFLKAAALAVSALGIVALR